MANNTSSLVAGYTTDANSRPFVKSRTVSVHVTGVRPNTALYVLFNGVNVSQYCKPASIDSNGSVTDEKTWTYSGNFGDSIVSAEDGSVSFAFRIPRETFLVGTGVLVVQDDLDDDQWTTRAEVTYNTLDRRWSGLRAVQNAVGTTRSITGRDTTATKQANPISQLFYISTNMSGGKEGIFVSGVDMYFSGKDSTYGGCLEIRNVENNKPTTTALPLARRRLRSDEISITAKTEIEFPGLVYLRAGFWYSLSFTPDAGAENYLIKTAVVGQTDSATLSTISNVADVGPLFLPSNASEWTPLQNEFMQFSLRRADFIQTEGNVVLTNKDYEFLTVANVSGTFLAGERVISSNGSSIVGVATANTLSTEIIGFGTTFTNLTVNSYVVIVSGNTVNARLIKSIANNTSMQIQQPTTFSNTASTIRLAPTGVVVSYSSIYSRLTLVDSTAANSTFLFSNNAILTGSDSGATATVSSVDNRNVSKFQPVLSFTNVSDTDIGLGGQIIANDYASVSETNYNLSGTNFINDRQAVVASKSNEILYFGGNKSFSMNVDIYSNSSRVSPAIDLSIPSVVLYGNRINANTSNETTRTGAAYSKAVTKTVTLANGQEAEDLLVNIAAYRPPGTDIEVYAKILNSSDPGLFIDKDWSKLTVTNATSSVYSDAVNTEDFVDLQYTFPTTLTANIQPGVISIANTTANVSGIGTTFTGISNGSIIRIDSGASYGIVKVANVSNNTFLTLSSNAPFTSLSGTYSTIAEQRSAFKNPQNGYIVRYYGSDGAAYDTYKNFALKIVFKADYVYLTPKVDNIRAIAVS